MSWNRRSFLGMAGATVAGGWFIGAGERRSGDKIRVLIVTGQNNHDWKRTTPFMEQILNEADRFQVSISTSPPSGAERSEWDAWQPEFPEYDVVLSDYNGQMWPDRVREQFVKFVDEGGRVLIQHAANNAFPGWQEYEEMVGLLWRGAGEGTRLYLDEAGREVREPAGEGIGAGHGGLHDWAITTPNESHPIFRDLPLSWLHAHDELYHGQRGPVGNLNLLATALSSRNSGGTGWHEPMVWWVPYGNGKVLTFLPGHLWSGQQDTRAFRCVGFRCLLQRCCQWLAAEEVDIPIPDPFPTAEEAMVVPDYSSACCIPRRWMCDIC